MNSDVVPNLNAAGRTPNLLSVTDPLSMKFLHTNQTQSELLRALFVVTHAPWPHSSRIYLLASEFEVILTFLVCSVMLYKKRSLGKLWIITKRESHHGTFYVANAVFVLVLGVAAYLVSWDITALLIAVFSYTNLSSMRWWCVIPLPWLPLVLGAYVSIHGFTVGCSPRSPLSYLSPHHPSASSTTRWKWYYLPVPKSPVVCNLTLFLPCVLFIISTVGLVVMSGQSFIHAEALLQQLLPVEFQQHFKTMAGNFYATFPDDETMATEQLVWAARRIAAAHFEIHRYVCINLAVFAACAYGLFIPCVIYGLPNLNSLVDHVCSLLPAPLPPTCKRFFPKLWHLVTEGKPQKGENTSHLKMTVLAVTYIAILVVCVPAFAWLPVFVIADSYPKRVLAGDIRDSMSNAVLAVSVITILSCTFVAVFCTVATLDPLFRAAIGLNVIRTRIAIDIQVEHHRSRHEETHLDLDLELASPPTTKEDATLRLQDIHPLEAKSVASKPSYCTFHSGKATLLADDVEDELAKGDEQHFHLDQEQKTEMRVTFQRTSS